MPVAMEITVPSGRFRPRRQARKLLRSMLERFGCLASVVIGVSGLAGFVASEALLAAHRLPMSAGSWCLALSLAVYGLALGLGRLHEVVSAGAAAVASTRPENASRKR